MTSCRNLFHSFPLPFAVLSSLSRLFPLFLSACHQTCINTFYFFHRLPPLLSALFVFSRCSSCVMSKQRCFPFTSSLESEDLQLLDEDLPRPFCCQVSSSPSSPRLSPSFVRSLAASPSLPACRPLSQLPSASCHSPLSNFHGSICWPTGCVTDSSLRAA